MKHRDVVAMTPEEVTVFLLAGRKVQLATNGPDGFPHLVTMYYVMKGGQIAFWTYRSSQKARNLERDPRISCLVESGEQYYDLRGVLVRGTARRIEEPAEVAEIGHRITGVLAGGTASGALGVAADAGQLDDYVARAARKRVGYCVQAERIISWDHAKLTDLPRRGRRRGAHSTAIAASTFMRAARRAGAIAASSPASAAATT